jgi:hypothetical protein
MSEVIFQQQNSQSELFIVRQNGILQEFSVKKQANGEINLGQLDTTTQIYKIWRDTRHILMISDRKYIGINKKIVFESKTLRAIEIETRDGVFLVEPKSLPGKEIIVKNENSFLDEFYVPYDFIINHEQAPF